MTLEELDRLEKHSTCGPMRIHAGYLRSSNFRHVATLGDGNTKVAARFADASEANVTAAARNALPKLLAVAKAAKEMRMHDRVLSISEDIKEVNDSWVKMQEAIKALDAALAEMEKA